MNIRYICGGEKIVRNRVWIIYEHEHRMSQQMVHVHFDTIEL